MHVHGHLGGNDLIVGFHVGSWFPSRRLQSGSLRPGGSMEARRYCFRSMLLRSAALLPGARARAVVIPTLGSWGLTHDLTPSPTLGREPRGGRPLSLSYCLSIPPLLFIHPYTGPSVKLKPLCSEHFMATSANRQKLAWTGGIARISLCSCCVWTWTPPKYDLVYLCFLVVRSFPFQGHLLLSYISLGPRFCSLLCFWSLFFFFNVWLSCLISSSGLQTVFA